MCLIFKGRKPELQMFTIWSGILASINSRQHSAFSPLPEWTDYGPAVWRGVLASSVLR